MRVVMFYHSLVSDWNHGNAHFLRGIVSELQSRGHDVTVWEPEGGWSYRNLIASEGPGAIEDFPVFYPGLSSRTYPRRGFDVEQALAGADLVIVHEWTDPELVAQIGCIRRRQDFRLLYHDTHHRAVSNPNEIAAFDLSAYDGALVFGESLRLAYAQIHPELKAWVWHEAADMQRFRPLKAEKSLDLVWVGNWGDAERVDELREFLLEPAKALGLTGRVHGVRYPQEALDALAESGLEYGGWLPNYRVPEVFAKAKVTVHIPRRPYVQALPGIPTIRVFEALACGIPLISAPWNDSEGLFEPGEDFLVAHNGGEMQTLLRALLSDEGVRGELAGRGYRTVLRRHTCAHRVDELLEILKQ